ESRREGAVLFAEAIVRVRKLAQALHRQRLEAVVGEELVTRGIGAHPVRKDRLDLLGDHADLRTARVAVLARLLPLEADAPKLEQAGQAADERLHVFLETDVRGRGPRAAVRLD